MILADTSTKMVREVYKFSTKTFETPKDEKMNTKLKQKRLLDAVEGFFMQIDEEMKKMEVIFCF